MRFAFTVSGLGSRLFRKSPACMGRLPDSRAPSKRTSSLGCVMGAWFLLFTAALASTLSAAQDEGKALREAATKFWDARVKGDWAVVYDYLSEEERAGKTKGQYIEVSKAAGTWRYLQYQIHAVETSDDLGWVKIQSSAEALKFPGTKPRTVTRWEHWEKEGDRWTIVPSNRVGELPKLPPSLRQAAEEKAVTAREEEFWKARERSDYAAIYKLLAPSFRNQITLEEWLGKKAQDLYLSHQILWAEVNNDRAVVRTEYEHRLNDPMASKMTPSIDVSMQQWIKVDGQWYLDLKVPEE